MEDLYFNGEKLTPETIAKTRQHFIDIFKGCISEAVSGEVRVNDLHSYIKSNEARIKEYENATHTISLTFLQRAYWLQTGKSIALLP